MNVAIALLSCPSRPCTVYLDGQVMIIQNILIPEKWACRSLYTVAGAYFWTSAGIPWRIRRFYLEYYPGLDKR